MFGFKKSPISKIFKHNSVDPGHSSSSSSNPFDSDTESDKKQTIKPAKRSSSEPTLIPTNFNNNPFGDDDKEDFAARNNYRNDFSESGGLEQQSVQELENYVVHKAGETTKTVNGCLKIAEDIREDASNTLVTLHQQGEQITRTHMMAADMDQDLSRGEKLLGNLGGMFSKTWKPKKTHAISGPMITGDGTSNSKLKSREQREKLGLSPAPIPQSAPQTPPPESTNAALQKIEAEKGKQDVALSDLSNVLGDLKSMAVDMGSEIEKQNKSLDHLYDDVAELDSRVKGANRQTRRLLHK